MKKFKIKKRIIIIPVVLVTIFAVLNVGWMVHKYNCYDKVIKNHSDFVKREDENQTMYSLSVTNSDRAEPMQYSVGMFYPTYLKYNGNYCVSQTLVLNEEKTGYENQYSVLIAIKPHIFGDMIYQFSVTDYTDNGKVYAFETNDKLEVTYYSGLSPDKLFSNSEAMAEINETFNIAKEYFGAD